MYSPQEQKNKRTDKNESIKEEQMYLYLWRHEAQVSMKHEETRPNTMNNETPPL